MALDPFEGIMLLLVALSAVFAAVAGLITLEGFFRNKLKQLFDDVNYFIFFFLVMGYFLYALGEISWYLVTNFVQGFSGTGVQDIYWLAGALLILVSFIILSIHMFREHPHHRNMLALAAVGMILVISVLLIIFSTAGSEGTYVFSYIYPILSALIVSFSSSIFFFFGELGGYGRALLFFFLASSAILLGDILFHYTAAQEIYGIAGMMTDVFYLSGYALSGIAFIYLRLHMNTISLEKE